MITSRNYRGELDHECITTFLQKVYTINRDQQCWLTPRFHYGLYFVNPLIHNKEAINTNASIRLWQSENQDIIGMVNKEDVASTYVQVHPDYQCILEEMILWIIENPDLYSYNDEGINSIKIWCNDARDSLKHILTKLGFKKQVVDIEYQMWKTLDFEMPAYNLHDHYSICCVEDDLIDKRLNTYIKAFNIDKIPIEVYQSVQKSPLYRKELDLVIIRQDDVVAFCTVWFDEKNQIGVLEPVGTHPNYQIKGLAKALVYHACSLLKERNCKTVYLSAYGKVEVGFYNSTGFKNYDISYPWIRLLS